MYLRSTSSIARFNEATKDGRRYPVYQFYVPKGAGTSLLLFFSIGTMFTTASPVLAESDVLSAKRTALRSTVQGKLMTHISKCRRPWSRCYCPDLFGVVRHQRSSYTCTGLYLASLWAKRYLRVASDFSIGCTQVHYVISTPTRR
jgi:hypothetical protein